MSFELMEVQNRYMRADTPSPSSELSSIAPPITSDQEEIEQNEARRKDSSASPLSFALLNAQIGQDPRASAEIENNKNTQVVKPQEENHKNNHMILTMDNGNGANYDTLIEFDCGTHAVECEINQDFSIAEIQAETHQPQTWDKSCQSSHIEDARLMKCKPDRGKAHLTGKANLTTVLIESKEH